MDKEKLNPITISVSSEMLNEIDSRTPDRRVCRERFLMDDLEAYLGHPERVVDRLKDNRYE
jgi:hypothetical protein